MNSATKMCQHREAFLEDWEGRYVVFKDGPVLDPRCTKCGQFYTPGECWVNGLDQPKFKGFMCKCCGEIEPWIVCWEADLRT